jgi:hypothetical protein
MHSRGKHMEHAPFLDPALGRLSLVCLVFERAIQSHKSQRQGLSVTLHQVVLGASSSSA